MQVSDIMSPNVVSITPDESVSLASRLLSRNNIGCLPVCGEDGKLWGIVTDRDIVLRCIAAENDPQTTPVKSIMSKGLTTVGPTDDVRVATKLMSDEQVRRLPVVKGDTVVGMLALGDMAKTHTYDMEASKALSEISSNIRSSRFPHSKM